MCLINWSSAELGLSFDGSVLSEWRNLLEWVGNFYCPYDFVAHVTFLSEYGIEEVNQVSSMLTAASDYYNAYLEIPFP